MTYRHIFLKLFVSAAIALQCAAAHAITFTSITAIGDSAFDGGNEPTAVISAYKLFGLPANASPAPGYYNFKYCNGYTAAEYFAYYMGMYDSAHFFNYSVAGISSIELPLVLQRIYQRTPTLDATGLYVIYVGAHDVFQSKISRAQTAENIRATVADLYNHGARYFLVMNLQKMSDLPSYSVESTPQIEAVDIAYQAINSELKTKLDSLTFRQNVVQFDTANFSRLVTQYARSVGFTNLTQQCASNSAVCATPDTYVYWDDIHFSNATNGHLGVAMKAAVDAAALN